MSGVAGAGGHGGVYGDPAAAAGFPSFGHHDDDDFFFQSSSPFAGGGGGGGDGLMMTTTPYSSIADYLQGFLDPAGLAAHLDDDAPRRTGDDVVVKQEEMAAVVQLLGHRDDIRDGQQAGAPPVTPNSSVRSSSSCEAVIPGDEQRRRRCKKGRLDPEEEEEEQEFDAEAEPADERKCKRSKEQKRGEKKAREPRVAFMTRSEVDHLEDGYRWRKYGQKAVKNSSYPRSYYRCTAARCGVKKRVERSQQDPSTVITTYEGQHTHHSPVNLLSLRGTASRVLFQHGSSPPLQLGLRPDLLGAGATITPTSLLPPLVPRDLLPPSMRLFLQEEHHRRRASSQLELDFIPSAMSNGHA